MKPYDDFRRKTKNPTSILVTTNKHYIYTASIITDGSVLDAGAGFQTLKDYLSDSVSYTGIDATEWVCDLGGATLKDVMEHEGLYDYVCAFGILETADNLKNMADKLKSLATKAVLFSFIKTGDKVFKAYTQEQITEAFGECTFTECGAQTLATCEL